MSDPAVDAAERATQPRGIPWAVGPGRYALHGAREALAWAADVVAQEAREQWAKDSQGVVGAQMIAQRLDVIEAVIRGEK